MAKNKHSSLYVEANNYNELKRTLETSSVDDLVNPEIWAELNEDEATELRKWLERFIKENVELPEEMAGMVAYPYINEKLSRILQKVTLNMTAKRTAEMIKNNIKGGENAVQ